MSRAHVSDFTDSELIDELTERGFFVESPGSKYIICDAEPVEDVTACHTAFIANHYRSTK